MTLVKTAIRTETEYHQQASPITVAGRKTMTEDPTSVSKPTSKEEVHYRVSGMDQSACGNCRHGSFPANPAGGTIGACKLIAGPIRAAFVCDRWAQAGPSGDDRGGVDDQ